MASKRQRVVIGGGSEGAGGSGAGGRHPRSSSSSDSGGGNGGPQFVSDAAREAYSELLGRPIARERGLLPTTADGYMLDMIEERGWEQLCEIPDPVPMSVVREFYANASVNKDGISQVRGFRVDYRPRAIRRVLGLPTPRRNQEDWSGRTRDSVDLQMLIQRMCVPGTQWTLRRGTTEPTSFLSTALNPYARTWHLFICANLIPTRHSNEVTVERAILLYAICSREFVDVGNLIHQGILRFMQGSTTAAMPYGAVIARLARDSGAQWSDAEGVQQPQAALDHQSIRRLSVWDGGEPDHWGLGYVVEQEEQEQQQQQQGEEPQVGGSALSQQQYRRLLRRIDAVHDMQAGFAADFGQFAQALSTAFRATGVDVTFPSFGAGAVYPPPDTPTGSASDDE